MGLIIVEEEQANGIGQKLSSDAEVMLDLATLCFGATVFLTHWDKWAQSFSSSSSHLLIGGHCRKWGSLS